MHTYTLALLAGIGNILDRSLVEDYQHRLAAKRQEVARLQQQRDELLATQRRLLKLQHQVAEAEIQVSKTITRVTL